MRLTRGLVLTLLLAQLALAPLCAGASIDFAVSLSLPSLNNRFGVDRQGNILIAANPTACSLPTVKPLYTCGPIWIGKLDASGKSLLFATYLGGTAGSASSTVVAGIAADASGNIIVAAHTSVQDMPTVNAYQPKPSSTFVNLYVAKLASDGSRLTYATYLGGTGAQTAMSLAVDNAGAAYVAASINSTDFPTTPQSFRAAGLYQTAIAKLDPNGGLQYAALFPFEFFDGTKPVQLDAMGRAVLVSNLEALILSPDGSSLIRATYPLWATQSSPCIVDATDNTWCAQPPWAIPRSNGGLKFAGSAGLGVPVTADAFQITGEPGGHLLIENGQANHTQLTVSVAGFAVDPKNRNQIYAATPNGLFVSADNGATWSVLRDGPCLAIAVDPFDSNRLYLSLDPIPNVDTYSRVYRSTDRGGTWTAVLGGPNSGGRILSLAADPNVRGLLYGAGPSLFRSTNGGDTWSSQFVGPSHQDMSPSASTSTKSQFVQVDPTHPGWAYVIGFTNCIGFCGNFQNLSRTEDGGKTWFTATPGSDPSAPYNATVFVAVDPSNSDVIEPANGNALIYRKGDFSTFQILFPAETTSAAFDPDHPGTIYLAVHIAKGSNSGYFVVQSVDDGVTWTNVLQFDRPVYNLTVSSDGVLQASQAPNPPQAYFLESTSVGNISYGTYFGSAFTQITSMEGSGDNAVVAGTTEGGLPLVNPVQPAVGGGTDGFVAVFSESGPALWSTYIGGSGNDSIEWVMPLPDGSVVVVGTTNSSDFPMLQASPLGAGNTFIAHLRP